MGTRQEIRERRCRWSGKICPACRREILPGQREALARSGQPLRGWCHTECLIAAQQQDRLCGCVRSA